MFSRAMTVGRPRVWAKARTVPSAAILATGYTGSQSALPSSGSLSVYRCRRVWRAYSAPVETYRKASAVRQWVISRPAATEFTSTAVEKSPSSPRRTAEWKTWVKSSGRPLRLSAPVSSMSQRKVRTPCRVSCSSDPGLPNRPRAHTSLPVARALATGPAT